MMNVLVGAITGIICVFLAGMVWRKQKILPEMRTMQMCVLIAGAFLLTSFSTVVTLGREFSMMEIARIIVLYIFLMTVAWIDYKKHCIPNTMILAALGIRIFIGVGEYLLMKDAFWQILLLGIFGAVFGFAILIAANKFSKGGLGMGDVKMYMIVGLYIGIYGTYNVLFYSVIFMLLSAGIMILLKKLSVKSQVPFAPFTFAGYCLIILMGAI